MAYDSETTYMCDYGVFEGRVRQEGYIMISFVEISGEFESEFDEASSIIITKIIEWREIKSEKR